jgi:hypothetical protein
MNVSIDENDTNKRSSTFSHLKNISRAIEQLITLKTRLRSREERIACECCSTVGDVHFVLVAEYQLKMIVAIGQPETFSHGLIDEKAARAFFCRAGARFSTIETSFDVSTVFE